MAFTLLLPPSVVPATANGGSQVDKGSRTLYLHHTHTGETAYFTFKRNGKYDQAVLQQMNVFLADWRTKDRTKMDPALFDLLWEVYQEVGATQPYNIVSSYRAPKTNAMLRAKSSGVAENSQHMRGKAMDVFIPGVNLAKLRAAAMRHQVGGVGYYPTSGSPFVHMDTGNVRAWPRMTRAQLEKVFPDGKTLHLPVDGKPLSSSGRAYAQAQWTKCHTVPCDGKITFDTDPGIMIANNAGEIAPIPADRPENLYGEHRRSAPRLGRNAGAAPGADHRRRRADTGAAAQDDWPSPRLTPTIPSGTSSAHPSPRSSRRASSSPPARRWAKMTARRRLPPSPPLKHLLSRPGRRPRCRLRAHQPGAGRRTGTQDDHRARDHRLPARPADEKVAAAGPRRDADRLSRRHQGPQRPERHVRQDLRRPQRQWQARPMADALADLVSRRQPNASIAERDIELVAPEIDHVNETLVQPVMMTDGFWAVLSEAEGYLDKGTELGPLTGRIDFIPDDAAVSAYDHFVTGTPQLVAGL